jgi:hypothetical protein
MEWLLAWLTRSRPRLRSANAKLGGAWKAKHTPLGSDAHFDTPPVDSVPSRLPSVMSAARKSRATGANVRSSPPGGSPRSLLIAMSPTHSSVTARGERFGGRTDRADAPAATISPATSAASMINDRTRGSSLIDELRSWRRECRAHRSAAAPRGRCARTAGAECVVLAHADRLGERRATWERHREPQLASRQLDLEADPAACIGDRLKFVRLVSGCDERAG